MILKKKTKTKGTEWFEHVYDSSTNWSGTTNRPQTLLTTSPYYYHHHHHQHYDTWKKPSTINKCNCTTLTSSSWFGLSSSTPSTSFSRVASVGSSTRPFLTSTTNQQSYTTNKSSLTNYKSNDYNHSCLAFSGSIPEFPVALSDDEFLVDTGIRMPEQWSTSLLQNEYKIPYYKRLPSSVDYENDKSRFGYNRRNNDLIKIKRNSLNLDENNRKLCMDDGFKSKRHSMNYTLPIYGTDRLGRALRRYLTLDLNHNQGISKIPLRSNNVGQPTPGPSTRNNGGGSRTAPATRASSPVRVNVRDWPTNRFTSSEEEIDKLCSIILNSRNVVITTANSTPTTTTTNVQVSTTRNKDNSRLPVCLLRKKS